MTKLPKPTLAIREFDNTTTPQILQVGSVRRACACYSMDNPGYMTETSGQAQSAANLYTGELRNYPSSVTAITGLARLFENQGDYREANNYHTRAIGIRPDYEPAIKGLTRLNEYQNKP